MQLFHFWSSPAAQRVRLALGYKRVAYEDIPLGYWDDETFFELGVERKVPVVKLDNGTLLTDSIAILENIDEYFPDAPALRTNIISDDAWQALQEWRNRVELVLQRLYAPALVAYRDIGDDDSALKDYKNTIRKRFGLSVENLANDRYDNYAELAKLSNINALARHLAKNRFYIGPPSIADMLITADLFPLQLLDGVSLPIDMLYYFRRVEEICQINLREGMLATLD